MRLINYKLIKQTCIEYNDFASEPVWWIYKQSAFLGFDVVIWDKMPDFGKSTTGYRPENILTDYEQ